MSGEFRSCCNCIDGVRVVHNTASACPCPCHKEETVKDKELNLEEVKVIFDVRLSESNEFYPMKEVGLKLIKEVERLRVVNGAFLQSWHNEQWELNEELTKENTKLQKEVIKLSSKRDYWMGLYRESNSDELFELVAKMGRKITRLQEEVDGLKGKSEEIVLLVKGEDL